MSHPELGGRGRAQHEAPGHDDSYGQVYIAVIQLQGEVKALTAMIALRDAGFNDEIRRMREDGQRERTDHETRIRVLEARRYVDPKTVWSAFGLTVTLGSLIVAIINLITR